MLEKSISGVLSSLRGSTYRNVRLAASLTTALLDGIWGSCDYCAIRAIHKTSPAFYGYTDFFRSLLISHRWAVGQAC